MPQCDVLRAIFEENKARKTQLLVSPVVPKLTITAAPCIFCRPLHVAHLLLHELLLYIGKQQQGPMHAGSHHQQLVAEVAAVPATIAQSMARVSAVQSTREMELLRVPSRGSSLPPPPPLTPTISCMRSADKGPCSAGSDQALYTDQRQSHHLAVRLRSSHRGQHALWAVVTCKSALLRDSDLLE